MAPSAIPPVYPISLRKAPQDEMAYVISRPSLPVCHSSITIRHEDGRSQPHRDPRRGHCPPGRAASCLLDIGSAAFTKGQIDSRDACQLMEHGQERTRLMKICDASGSSSGPGTRTSWKQISTTSADPSLPWSSLRPSYQVIQLGWPRMSGWTAARYEYLRDALSRMSIPKRRPAQRRPGAEDAECGLDDTVGIASYQLVGSLS